MDATVDSEMITGSEGITANLACVCHLTCVNGHMTINAIAKGEGLVGNV